MSNINNENPNDEKKVRPHKPYAKHVKKFDTIEIQEEKSDIFISVSDIENLCKTFKEKAIETLKTKRWKRLEMNLDEFEKFFKFKINPNHGVWLPKRFRDELVKQGVHIFKKRGRTFCTITIDGIK